MLTGAIRNQVDQIWNAFWSGGVSNPLSVIEQITYLLFIKRLDDLHTLEESKAEMLDMPMERRIFPEGADDKGRDFDGLRWSRFKNFEAREMMTVVDKHVFPFLQSLGEEGSAYGAHMRDARLGFSNPNLLAKVVQMLDEIPMDDRDTKGDVYEYMLGKIASAGQNGQFRTPRHIINLMVHLMKPTPEDVICDPAAGTCGFLVSAGEYLRDHHPQILHDDKLRKHFHSTMFHGHDFDSTMLRIGAMNMTLHGVENPDISYRDSLAEEHGVEEGAYSLILANPPFAGSLDYDSTAKDLQKMVRTKEDRTAFRRPLPAPPAHRRAGGGGRAGWRVFRLVQGAQGHPQDAGRGPQAGGDRQAALGRLPALCRCFDRHHRLHQDRRRRDGERLVL